MPTSYTSRDDSLLFLFRMSMISEVLTEAGRGLVDDYLQVDWSRWRNHMSSQEPFEFSKSIELIASRSVAVEDSSHMFFAFRMRRDISESYRLFLHLDEAPPGGRGHNFDFRPETPTNGWKKADIVLCSRQVPRFGVECSYILGFFNDAGRYGRAFKSHLPAE
jgi:hypothetical protein